MLNDLKCYKVESTFDLQYRQYQNLLGVNKGNSTEVIAIVRSK